jgi:hypothetical protein
MCSPCRAGQAERRVHKAAAKHNLNLDVEITYFQIPVCTDQSTGQVEFVPWPFLLPSDLASLLKYGFYTFFLLKLN